MIIFSKWSQLSAQFEKIHFWLMFWFIRDLFVKNCLCCERDLLTKSIWCDFDEIFWFLNNSRFHQCWSAYHFFSQKMSFVCELIILQIEKNWWIKKTQFLKQLIFFRILNHQIFWCYQCYVINYKFVKNENVNWSAQKRAIYLFTAFSSMEASHQIQTRLNNYFLSNLNYVKRFLIKRPHLYEKKALFS